MFRFDQRSQSESLPNKYLMLLEIGLDNRPLKENSTLFSRSYKVIFSHHRKLIRYRKLLFVFYKSFLIIPLRDGYC